MTHNEVMYCVVYNVQINLIPENGQKSKLPGPGLNLGPSDLTADALPTELTRSRLWTGHPRKDLPCTMYTHKIETRCS